MTADDPKITRAPAARPARRRGVILLFVVVLLTLLAVLGSAYLISAKIDAGSVNPKARGDDADTFNPDLRDPLATRVEAVAEAAQRQIFLGLFDRIAGVPTLGTKANQYAAPRNVEALAWRPAPAAVNALTIFQNNTNVYAPMQPYVGTGAATAADDPDPLRFPYLHVDGEGGTNTWLSSRTLWYNPAAAVNDFEWPWLSGPLVGLPGFPVDNAFFDPLSGAIIDLNSVGDATRSGAVPTVTPAVNSPAPADVLLFAGTNADFYNDRERVYPALQSATGGGGPFTAADADGDGVADSFLVPFVANAGQDVGKLARYVDGQTGMVYLYGIRIVDNNAAVNVNTALSSFGDNNIAGGGTDLVAGIDYDNDFSAPNWGIYPTNIGLLELFFQGNDADKNGFDDDGNGRTRNNEFHRFLPARLGNRTAMAVGTGSAFRGDVQFATLGEKITMNQTRLLNQPAKQEQMLTLNGADNATPFRSQADAAGLLFQGGGWLRPDASASPLQRAMPDALGTQYGNYAPSPAFAFDYFPITLGIGADPAAAPAKSAEKTERGLRSTYAALFKTADPTMTDFFARLPGSTGRPATAANAVDRFRAKLRTGTTPQTGTFAVSPAPGLTTTNGVSQAFVPKLLAGGDPTILTRGPNDGVPLGMPSYSPVAGANGRPPTKANVNTAGFGELWRAYFNVMVASAPGTTNSNGPAGTPADAGFDAPAAPAVGAEDAFALADLNAHGGMGLTREQVLLLRAALAAVNTMDVRDIDRLLPAAPPARYGTRYPPGYGQGTPDPGDNDVTVAEVPLGPGAAATTNFARVFGTEAQPYIDEVLLDVDPTGAVTMSLELFNPYPFPINTEGWQLVALDRTSGSAVPVSLVEFTTTNGTGFIPATDLLDYPAVTGPPAFPAHTKNGSPGMMYVGTAASPAGVTPPTPVTMPMALPADKTPRHTRSLTVFIDPILLVDGTAFREIVLMRPPRNDVPLATYGTTAAARAVNFVPLDAVDLRGITVTPSTAARYRYARPTVGSDATNLLSATRDWDYVYAGPWALPSATVPTNPANSTNVILVRDTATPPEVPDDDYNGEIGTLNTIETQLGPRTTQPAPTTRPVPMQVGPVLSGPWRAPGAGQPTYPYGGFARDGDALSVPFVGGYRLENVTGGTTTYDYVPLPLDVAFLEPLIGQEGAGHFYVHAVAGATENWAVDFFDYLAALNTPGADRFPQADPRYENLNPGGTPVRSDPTLYARGDITTAPVIWKDQAIGLSSFGGSTNPPTATLALFATPGAGTTPQPIEGFRVGANDYREAFQPVEGLINLNTADVGILKTLPLDVGASGNVTAGLTTGPTNSLFQGRFDGTGRTNYGASGSGTAGSGGPLGSLFSLFDFNDPSFKSSNPTTISRAAKGDITGRLNVDGSVIDDTNFFDVIQSPTGGDSEKFTSQLTRLSNLTTLRSDSFTVYIVVQAWKVPQAAADPPARLMREQRTAFTVDRSGVMPFKDPTIAAPVAWGPGDVDGDAYQQALKVTPIPTK